MVGTIYGGRNLRPLVIATGSLSALWTLLWAISSFQDMNMDKSNSFPKLATFSIVLGVMYMLSCAIEIFGTFAAYTQRIPLVRVYAMASVLSVLLVVTAGLLEVVVHFVDKNDIINECTKVTTGATIRFSFGLFGSSSDETLSQSDAQSFCQDGWDHLSWSSIISLLLEILLGTFFSLIAIAYYRQCLDPTSAANVFRAPSNQMRAGNMYPDHYNPPYNASVPNLGYGTGPRSYAPPPGPPPQFGAGDSADDLGKPPGYESGDYAAKYGAADKDMKENPFSDFEGNDKDAKAGEHDGFHV